ncbi:hypothetical protein R69658_06865 [Paraburkholderia aspalathi]|uniref:Uncharacterized protein n=1 Tax=Paraburkholderia aspalathi TaxID=1324617 RepID=A0ABN7N1H3_9BURK|nr:hypothetical protein [Paraburkholderia aspalathi]MBK3823197.1 hypothetical protein [Paraburkholderia aspalathi]MBK3835028.1 hypothetical protein [Paraburkholderia aspalathi]MBK3864800.1 hypothetical protein [Paraburkholderia aspalathi]CAE6844226.1 hypothetical protein R69658_06865 [Paraburkholderia aspalathi]
MAVDLNYVLIGNDLASPRASSASSVAVEPYGVRLPSILNHDISAVEQFVREWIPATQTITLDELLETFEPSDHDLAATTDDVLPMLSMGERVFLEELQLDAVSALELWHRIFGTRAARDRRASQTELTLAVEQIVGRSSRPEIVAYVDDVLTGSSLVLVREFARDSLREAIARCGDAVRRCTAALTKVRRRLISPVAETGSSAAIARRMNPHGAPPQFA